MATSQSYLANGTYPDNWKEISRYRREVIASRQCEWEEDGTRCPRKHGEPIPGNEQRKTILTTAHLDHNPANCAMDNLRSWCQAHHLRYDALLHAKHAKETRHRKQREEALEAGQLSFE